MVAFAEVLQAAGPDPDLAGPLALFGRFTGAWDIEWRGADQDGKPVTMRGDLHFGWVLTAAPSRTSGGALVRCRGARAAAVSRHHAALLRSGAGRLAVDLDRSPPAGFAGSSALLTAMTSSSTGWMTSGRALVLPHIAPRSARSPSGGREVSTDGRRTWRLDEEMLIRRCPVSIRAGRPPEPSSRGRTLAGAGHGQPDPALARRRDHQSTGSGTAPVPAECCRAAQAAGWAPRSP
jgi:hypothetical protein